MSTLAAVMQARVLASALAGATSSSAPISVVVDAAVVDREALAARVLAGVEAELEGSDDFSGGSSSGPSTSASPLASIVITGELLDFRVHLVVPGTARGMWSSRCTCTHAELVPHVQRALAHALLAREPGPAPGPVPAGHVGAPASAKGIDPVRPGPASHGRGLGPSGRVGAVLGGLGGLALGAGAAALAITHRFYDETFQTSVDLRAQGIAAAAVGGTLLTSGAVLLLLDRRRRQARSESHR